MEASRVCTTALHGGPLVHGSSVVGDSFCKLWKIPWKSAFNIYCTAFGMLGEDNVVMRICVSSLGVGIFTETSYGCFLRQSPQKGCNLLGRAHVAQEIISGSISNLSS